MPHPHKKKVAHKKLKQLALAIIAGCVATFFLFRTDFFRAYIEKRMAEPQESQTGYKAKDRLRLEKLIHEESEND